jgi:hypothetical protein
MTPRTFIVVCQLVVPLTLGCQQDGVGDPCVPEEEYASGFPGFGIEEVGVETQSVQCMTRLCLVNHFQGRVSCPGGQTQTDLALDGSVAGRCRAPGSGDAQSAVSVPVAAWDIDRPPDRAVYCSCRCDGPDRAAHYCECPEGYECTELIPDMGLGATQLPGSYCVREGTAFEAHERGGPTCATDPRDPVCAE